MREVLYSPGYGAGWSTWHSGPREEVEMMLFDEQLIAEIKREGKPTRAAYESFFERFATRFPGSELPYSGGFFDLRVGTVTGPFRIEEYDGHETIQEAAQTDWF
jgi:hypothetical protein